MTKCSPHARARNGRNLLKDLQNPEPASKFLSHINHGTQNLDPLNFDYELTRKRVSHDSSRLSQGHINAKRLKFNDVESLKYTKDSLDHTTRVSGRKRLFSFSGKDFVGLNKSYDYAEREILRKSS